MSELGSEARSIVDAARGAEKLPRESRSRIKHAVLAQVAALGAASTAAGGAAAMSVATKVTLIALTATVLGGGSYSLWTWKRREAAPATTTARAESPRPSRPVAPAVVAPTRPEPAASETRRRDGVRSGARRPVPGPAPVFERLPNPGSAEPSVSAPPSRTIQSLSPELLMLQRAQEDLRAGLPAQALRRLQEYDRQFVKGTLDQERQAIEAIARCQIGLDPAARARAERFLRQSPESPLAGRVRTACEEVDRAGGDENARGREP